MNFFEILYAKKNGAALPANFFDLLFAKSFTPATEWGEYDGTLPAQFNANGSILVDYRVYGSAGGVGDRTENLFDGSISQGGWGGTNDSVILRQNDPNYEFYSIRIGVDDPIQLDQSKSYTFKAFPSNIQVAIKTATVTNVQINDTGWGYTQIISNCQYAIVTLRKSDNSSINPNDVLGLVIIEGSTAPAEYVPYGYKLDMSVSDGTTSTITPIYIGSDPLGEDEYVDYDEQKIYRMSGGVLTPADPPVPLPALPTVDGTNIVDYTGQSAAVPSRFYAKYQKG